MVSLTRPGVLREEVPNFSRGTAFGLPRTQPPARMGAMPEPPTSPPQRIVCLCPSITEALFEIGAGPRVVGVTDYCIHPADAVEALPKVGGSKLPNLDAIFELSPDLVIMNEEENRVEDFEAIQERGIPILNTFPKTVAESAHMMRDVGRAVGCVEAAEESARAIERAVASAKSQSSQKPRLRGAVLIWMRPFMGVNADTFMHDMLALAGIDNVFGSRPQRYPRLEAADLRCGLDVILLPNEPFEFVGQHATEIAAAAGIPTARAVLCDGQFLTWYGTRTPRGVEYAQKLAERIRGLAG